MFLPETIKEIKNLGWDRVDVIFVTGDAYIDSPYNGVAILGKLLLKNGFRVAIIPQPDINSSEDIMRFGEPTLFWGVTAGMVDSMVANYTASFKKRNKDDLTPGGVNNRRPDRATIVYTNLIRRYFKNTVPIVLGGVEASLRRVAHYDAWKNEIKKSILFDAKGDYLVYGMGEKTVLEIANSLKNRDSLKSIRGLCYISKEIPENYIELPTFNEVLKDKKSFFNMFSTFYENSDPIIAKGLVQKHDETRYLVQNPPQYYEKQSELDLYYDSLDYEYDLHPNERAIGSVKALDTIKSSITTHRGCFGECNFCSIAIHQGRVIRSRSESSILKEIDILTKQKNFKGFIFDVGGATANMYEMSCAKAEKHGVCKDKRCIFPKICPSLKLNHEKQISLLKKLRDNKKIKKLFISSGIRYDLIVNDKINGERYLKDILTHHISGQMKIAPEHTGKNVLECMGKPDKKTLFDFLSMFHKTNQKLEKKLFLSYYFMTSHPNSTVNDQKELKNDLRNILKYRPEQVQIFTPTPSTWSTLFYYTEYDYKKNTPIFVEKNRDKKEKEKSETISL
ncbi:YgiQ family radical SAM protein [bacterium]|nr:YgiQ family radical SAM protein [bacterium]